MTGTTSGGGAPGLLSPFDISAFGTGLAGSEAAMGERYAQLGLGGTGATPTSPGSLGPAGTTAERMDLGLAPSLTGGIPAEFSAGLGQVQSQDLGQTLSLALNNLNTATSNKGNLLSGINTIGSKA